ncbi:hypothetical protein ACP275_08G112900 [Erythranthe tilingii]
MSSYVQSPINLSDSNEALATNLSRVAPRTRSSSYTSLVGCSHLTNLAKVAEFGEGYEALVARPTDLFARPPPGCCNLQYQPSEGWPISSLFFYFTTIFM